MIIVVYCPDRDVLLCFSTLRGACEALGWSYKYMRNVRLVDGKKHKGCMVWRTGIIRVGDGRRKNGARGFNIF